MGSIWIIIEQGTKYNDSTYDIAGEAVVLGNGFTSKSEAEAALAIELRKELSGFRLRDFDDYQGTFSRKGFAPAIDEFFLCQGIGVRSYRDYEYWEGGYDLKWDNFIEFCEHEGYKWRHFAPELLTIQEVKIPD